MLHRLVKSGMGILVMAVSGLISVLKLGDRAVKASARETIARKVNLTYEGYVSSLSEESQGLTMPVDTNFLTGSGSTLFFQLKSSSHKYRIDETWRHSNLQHVTGNTKDTSHDEGERVQGRISLGKSVDPSSGLFDITSG